MKKTIASMILLAGTLLVNPLYAEDNPEKLIQAGEQATEQVVKIEEKPEHRWRSFVEDHGWNGEMADGGVLIVPERELIISSATVFTSVRLGQPGWVESRVAAFEKAEMEAKAKIIRYMSETAQTKRTMSMLEEASWQDGDVEKAKQLNDVAETLKRLGKKSLDLAEAELNNALSKLDPDYDPEKYKNQSAEDLKVTAESYFKRQVMSIAMKTLIGVTPIYSTEVKLSEDEYAVLVGVVWSTKLNRLAMSLHNDEYSIPPVTPGKALTDHLPKDELTLMGTAGTRIVIDEKGHYALLSYGQAQPRKTSSSRKQAALHDATQIAANRARAHMVNFIKEGMTLRESEISDELSREFSDTDIGTEIVRDYRKAISSKKVTMRLRGLRVVKEWSFDHPVTGQKVAGAVLAWSPTSASLSKKASEMLNNGTKKKAKKVAEKEKVVDDGPSIQSMKVDTSAY